MDTPGTVAADLAMVMLAAASNADTRPAQQATISTTVADRPTSWSIHQAMTTARTAAHLEWDPALDEVDGHGLVALTEDGQVFRFAAIGPDQARETWRAFRERQARRRHAPRLRVIAGGH